ncbi:hypothetical protein Tco_1543151 [Tanacetum coccineum]
MTGDRSRLMNFVKKFIETVRFGNAHFGAIMGYGDYVIGDSVISRVYYMEGLGHNLFSVGQFCDSDLEVAFRKHSCYVHDTNGVELLKGSRESMANTEQALARASPVRTDYLSDLLSLYSSFAFDQFKVKNEQIVPRNRWVPIGKSNCYLNEEKSQRNPIFKIAVDILKQTNFFRAFTASSTIPAI